MSKKDASSKDLRRRGEDAVERYLTLLDYRILERGWKCPAGKIDLIAKEDDCLVFVTTRTRTSVDRGFPREADTPKRRERLEKIAAYYLRDYRDYDFPVRFDDVSLLVTAQDRAFVRHHKNVFGGGCL